MKSASDVDTNNKNNAPIRIHRKGLSQDRLQRLMKKKEEKKRIKRTISNPPALQQMPYHPRQPTKK